MSDPMTRQKLAELEARCDVAACEQFREWLSGQKADADKRARTAETERDRLRAEQAERRADQLDELLNIANDTANQSERERSAAAQRADKAEVDSDRLRAVLAEAYDLRRHGPATGPAWRAWDRKAETALRAGQDTAP